MALLNSSPSKMFGVCGSTFTFLSAWHFEKDNPAPQIAANTYHIKYLLRKFMEAIYKPFVSFGFFMFLRHLAPQLRTILNSPSKVTMHKLGTSKTPFTPPFSSLLISYISVG